MLGCSRLAFFFVDNVSSVFVKSVFKSSASLSDVLAVYVSVIYCVCIVMPI